jgi:Domain of unknown function (DUF4157)
MVLQGYFGVERFSRAERAVTASSATRRNDWAAKAPRPELLPGMIKPRVGMLGAAQGQSSGEIVTMLPDGALRLIGNGKPLHPEIRRTMESVFDTDFSTVRVHEGPAATAMGAQAFTLGDVIYFRPGLYDPRTREGVELLGHELTHVVQQRSGRVSNPNGRGVAIVQDRLLEAEADLMGRRIAGEVSSGARQPAPAAIMRAPRVEPGQRIHSGQTRTGQMRGQVIQPKVIVNDATLWSTAMAWQQIKHQIPDELSWRAYFRLNYWIKPPGTITVRRVGRVWDGAVRKFPTYTQLAMALVGDLRSDANMTKETALASRLYSDQRIIAHLKSILSKMGDYGEDHNWDWSHIQDTWRGAYFRWGPTKLGGGVKATTKNPYNDITNNYAAIRMAAYGTTIKGPEAMVHLHRQGSGEYELVACTEPGIGKLRSNEQTANEDNLWVLEARAMNVPVRVGPSNTMHAVFKLAWGVGATQEEILSLAWAAIIFYNQDYSWLGTAPHTMHEVMDVASQFIYNKNSEQGYPYNVTMYQSFLKDPFREKDD